jgi:hypothetical protein
MHKTKLYFPMPSDTLSLGLSIDLLEPSIGPTVAVTFLVGAKQGTLVEDEPL